MSAGQFDSAFPAIAVVDRRDVTPGRKVNVNNVNCFLGVFFFLTNVTKLLPNNFPIRLSLVFITVVWRSTLFPSIHVGKSFRPPTLRFGFSSRILWLQSFLPIQLRGRSTRSVYAPQGRQQRPAENAACQISNDIAKTVAIRSSSGAVYTRSLRSKSVGFCRFRDTPGAVATRVDLDFRSVSDPTKFRICFSSN